MSRTRRLIPSDSRLEYPEVNRITNSGFVVGEASAMRNSNECRIATYIQMLGIKTPWFVERLEPRVTDGEVHVYLEHTKQGGGIWTRVLHLTRHRQDADHQGPSISIVQAPQSA
jgi:hypothetical protein